jgi:VWFA-related protein
VIVCIFFAALGQHARAAQQSQNEPQQKPPVPNPNAPVLKVNARLVVLDVTVTDKSGNPVNDLTRDDFQIFEDKQPQRVRSFDPPSAHALPPATASKGAGATFDPAQPASFGSSPVTILVLDQLNTHFADSSFARRSLRDYLKAQPAILPQPTTLLALYDNRFRPLQPFTRSRESLLAALEAAPTEYAWELEQRGKAEYGPAERLDQSLRALEAIAQSYARISGRKNLIWVGGGFPTIDPTTIDRDDAVLVKNTLQHVTNVLLDTRVTLYAVDPTSSAPGMTEITDTTSQAFLQAAGDALTGGADPFDSSADFDKLGPVTGGRVVRGMNNITAQINSAVSLGGTFYTLSYAPTSASEAAASYRNIKVICLKPGLTVSTRSGYYTGPTKADTSNDTIEYDLTMAAESPVQLNALHVIAARDDDQHTPLSWNVDVDADGLTWEPAADGGSVAHVQIMAVSLSSKGKMLGHVLRNATADARASADIHHPSERVPFTFEAQPSPKAATLRFVVRDAETGRIGTFDLPLQAH